MLNLTGARIWPFVSAVLLASACAISIASAQILPDPGPIPQPSPHSAAPVEEPSDEVPPLPEVAPRDTGGHKDGSKSAEAPGPAAMPPEEVACRAVLAAAGATFSEHEPLTDPAGCSVPHPVSLESLGGGREITPPAVINCATAATLVAFLRDVVAPDAKTAFGAELKGIRQASGYVCRPRNGTSKLSEHAFGNAIDIASFMLDDGTDIAVDQTREPGRSEFLSRVRTAACGPFKTVLGPGSDADHATHFHFDLAERRNGSTFCQ